MIAKPTHRECKQNSEGDEPYCVPCPAFDKDLRGERYRRRSRSNKPDLAVIFTGPVEVARFDFDRAWLVGLDRRLGRDGFQRDSGIGLRLARRFVRKARARKDRDVLWISRCVLDRQRDRYLVRASGYLTRTDLRECNRRRCRAGADLYRERSNEWRCLFDGDDDRRSIGVSLWEDRK